MKKIIKIGVIFLTLICLLACETGTSDNNISENSEEKKNNTEEKIEENNTSETKEEKGETGGEEEMKGTETETKAILTGTFINASQKERGEFGTSTLELKEDQNFTLTEVEGMGAVEVKGNFGREQDVLMFAFDEALYDTHGNKLYNFEFRIVDDNTLELMRDLQGSKAGDCFSTSGTIPSNYEPQYKTEEVLCTGLKCKYKSYWAIANPINTYTLEVEVLPEDCTEVPTYESADESIATVDKNGTVTPGKVGKTVIHVTCGDRKLDINVESRAKTVNLEKIEMDDIVIDVGEKETIDVDFSPENATDKSLKFKSADGLRVSVSEDGEIKGLIPGPCDIYVTASNGETYTCHVMVEGEYLDIDLPLFAQISYTQEGYAPCKVFIHGYEDGEEYIDDVSSSATLHYEGGELEYDDYKLMATKHPGSETETTVWFTFKEYTTNKVTVYVEP